MFVIPDKKAFGERVAKLRLQKGVSAREMSLAMGQNEAYINSIENGKNHPSMECFYYICSYLDISPQQFFDTETESPKDNARIVEKLKHLNKDQLALIESMIDNMK